MQLKNTNIILGDFKLTLEKELEKINDLDFCFIDGNHQKNATITYFELCLKYSNNNTIYCAFKEKYIIKNTKCNCDNKCSATLSDLQLFNF